MSSASDSDTEYSEESIPPPKKSLHSAFRHYIGPLVFVTLCEYWMCDTVSKHIVDVSPIASQFPGSTAGAHGLGAWYWKIFATGIAGRVVCTVLWKVNAFNCAEHRIAGFFMIFSIAPWVCYLMFYYICREEMTGIQLSDNLHAGSMMTTTGMGPLATCIDEHGPLACRTFLRPQFGCSKEYNSDECSTFAFVGVNNTKCCVETTYSLTRPLDVLHFGSWNPTFDAFFSILKWVGVLATKWVCEKNPLDHGSYKPFVKGSLIDILDSIVFAAYLASDKVLLPKYGISTVGGRAAPVNGTLYYALLTTVCVAFSTAVLSPALYSIFRPTSDSGSVKKRSFTDALADLMTNVRMLRNKASHAYCDEALQLQLESYRKVAGSDDEYHAVIIPADESESVSDDEENFKALVSMKTVSSLIAPAKDEQRGKALHLGKGLYEVMYTNGDKKGTREKLDISKLRPDIERHALDPFAPGCCKGWCGGVPSDFDSKAEVLDSLRSLLLLELPFCLWRMWFEFASLDVTSFALILILKNLLWGLHDLLVILSCNNPAMTIFGFMPLASLNTLIQGSAMSNVFVGPAGFVRVAADVTTVSVKSRLHEEQTSLELLKAWLMVEREKVRVDGRLIDDDQGVQRFNAAIKQAEDKLDKVQTKLDMVHM